MQSPWMASTSPYLSVIIPAYNAAFSLRRCLDRLLAQATTVSCEIVVSDDGSSDNTAELMGAYQQKGVRYLRHGNVGRARNRNIGARNALGQVLVFLDADMLPSPGFLFAHCKAMQQAGERGVVLGAVPVAEECETKPVGRFMARKWERRLAALQCEPDNPFHMQSGNFSIRRYLFEELEGFDTTFIDYGGEDIDFFARAYLANVHFLYAPDALAYQLVDMRFADLLTKASQASQASNLILQRYPMLAARATVNQPVQPNLKGRIWYLFRQAPFSSWLLLKLLPLVERYCSDDVAFLIYNSLLSERWHRHDTHR